MRARNTTTGPRIAELEALEHGVGRDLAWIVAVCVVLVAAAVSLDAFGTLTESSSLDGRDLNGLLALLVVAPIGSTMYALRRYREGMHAQRALAGLTVRDGLTGLPNRQFLGESLRTLLLDQRRDLSKLAVLFMDLDRFKAVNDTYGHEVGDRLMCAVADRLVAAMRPDDVVVRYAGDEFVVVLAGVTNEREAERVASRLIHLLETPFEVGQDRIQISGSIGIAVDNGTATTDDLLRDADAAMYQAKAHGSGTYALFEGSMRDRLTPATAEKRMRAAIDGGEFSVFYRPVVSLWTRRVVTVETVMRWDDPTRGVIRPEEFLPALEDTGLIVPVGNWLMHQVCVQSRAWATEFADRPPINILVPVAARHLSQADFVDRIARALAETGAAAESIVLLVDERVLAGDTGMLRQTIRAAQSIGVRVAVSDAGAGLSVLGQVRHLDIDIVKVDAHAIASATSDRREAAVVAHVIGLAKALGIVTLANGVVNEADVEGVRTLGCDLAQGDYFAAPVSKAAIDELLRRTSGSPDPIADVAAPAGHAAEVGSPHR